MAITYPNRRTGTRVTIETGDTMATSTQMARSREQLAQRVIDGIGSIATKLVELEPDIRQLWTEFENLPNGETIMGCSTKKAFCETKLHRTPRAVRYLLNGGNAENMQQRREENISPAPEPETDEPTAAPAVEDGVHCAHCGNSAIEDLEKLSEVADRVRTGNHDSGKSTYSPRIKVWLCSKCIEPYVLAGHNVLFNDRTTFLTFSDAVQQISQGGNTIMLRSKGALGNSPDLSTPKPSKPVDVVAAAESFFRDTAEIPNNIREELQRQNLMTPELDDKLKRVAQAANAPAVEDDPELEQPTAPVKNPNYNKAGTRGYDLDKPNLNTFLRRLTAIAAFGAAPFPDVAQDALYECGERVESANAVVNHIDAATKRLNEYRAQFEAKMPPEQIAEPAELEITEDEARVIFANKNGEVLSDKTPNGNRNYHYITFERNGRFWRFNVDCQRGSKPRIMSADRTKNGYLCEEVFPVGVTEYRTREELAESGEVVAAPAPTAEPAIVELKEGTLVRIDGKVLKLVAKPEDFFQRGRKVAHDHTDDTDFDWSVTLYMDEHVVASKRTSKKAGA